MSRSDPGHRKLKADSVALAASAARQRRQQANQLSMVHRDAARWEKRMQSGAAGEGMEASTQVSSAQVLAALSLVKDALATWPACGQDKLLTAVRALRVCAGAHGSSDAALQGGAVRLLGKALELTHQDAPAVAEEAAWGLNNLMVSSSNAADDVLELLPLLLAGVSSPNCSCSGQCALALGNMAMEGMDCRERLLVGGAAMAVGRQVGLLGRGIMVEEEQASTSRPSPTPPPSALLHRTLCNCLWSLSQLIRGAPTHMEAIVRESDLLASLVGLLATGGEIWLEEVGWVLVYLSAGPASVCEALMQQRAGEVLVKQLEEMVQRGESEEGRWAQQLVPLLRCAGNLVCEMSPPDLKLAYSQHLLPIINQCLVAKHRGVRKEAARLCSFLPYLHNYQDQSPSNPSTPNSQQFLPNSQQSVPNSQQAIPQAALHLQQQVLATLLGMLLKASFDLRKEAAFAVAAWCAYDAEQRVGSGVVAAEKLLVQQLLEQQPEVLAAFLQLMRHTDVEVNRLALEFTELVLSRVPQGPQVVEAADGIDALEQIQYHCPREELASRAGMLVDKYYGEEYGLEDSGAPEPLPWAVGPMLGF